MPIPLADLDKAELGRWMLEYLESEPLPLSAVAGLQESITPGKWNALILVNGFSNYGGGFSPAAWRTIPGNGVQLRGVVQKAEAAGAGTVISSVPVSLAPKESLYFLGGANLSGEPFARVDVNPEGHLVLQDSRRADLALPLRDHLLAG
jgi:hypothetical protein